MSFTRLFSVLLAVFVLSVSVLASTPPARALVKIDSESVKLALKYGMQNGGLGYSSLLGPNWLEGTNGALLNIYTPFMMIASKAADGGWPTDPSDEDLKRAKNTYYRTIRTYTDDKYPNQVKFSVALYGDSPDFALSYYARIHGYGRGKEFELMPKRQMLAKVAKEVEGASAQPYEAVNTYYFDFDTLALMDEFTFTLTRRGSQEKQITKERKHGNRDKGETPPVKQVSTSVSDTMPDEITFRVKTNRIY